ncbi:MFS transporter [Roseobacter sp. HKCCD9010]|uniref:MFS transporter n=1 Tax=Rhodobacterales TaxID=204455 RepID=UPI0014930ACE|nr:MULTISPECIES: MFS transporter [Rhodobacterales]MBF9049491.1 MFS transporter [Rhodobacterales bacterium HKCCD4356]NNV11491.1 MFS transporter [Roseobacter sp. HKCCD7357]NNV15675.1 MFS transporter [Roseobacter sp. HKCCD8768]NNV25135.1 MFS transporter [Roseobacter sp. HKCCD8192]NNV29392.1 MFS transporter [Roseobacter sp. HKCCD9061]
MKVSDVFRFKNREIRALHLTWIAFFITFYVWFNMAPLASSILRSADWLTRDDLRLFAIANVALTIPARIVVGMALDKWGPRRVFSVLMVSMAIPTLFFAFGDTREQLFFARLVMSSVGASFVVGIHMTALWFKPRDIGFAEGFYAGWGNFGSAAAALTIPTVALSVYGGDDGWRYAIATSGIIMAAYGVFYWFAITDGPTKDTHKKPRKAAALEVSTYRDLGLLILFTIPLIGILSILVWRVQNLGYIDTMTASFCYAAIVVVVIYQVWQVLRVNLPILRKGVPEDDRYPFSSVAALNTTYFANFGAELAVVSMLPLFFQETWGLTPVTAGIIASSFAFVNLFARPMGGLVSDRMGNRRFVMLAYMLGIAIGFALMGLLDSTWPLIIAIAITIGCSFFVQGAEGATFGIIPSIKRRVTGQIAGMAGAYGNVGAVFYLFIFMYVTPSQFFFIISAGAAISWLACYFLLKEPEGGFGDEYVISSVDQAIADEARVRQETEADLATIFAGSERVGLADRGTGLTVTARFKDMDDLREALAKLSPAGGTPQTQK